MRDGNATGVDAWPLCAVEERAPDATSVERNPFRYYGGKAIMAKRLLPWIPYTKVYCEPFAVSAAIFFYRKPSPVEVLNDLNGDIVNFYRVLQDESAFQRLAHILRWTPYALSEFKRALELLKSHDVDSVMRAWAWFTAQNQGFGGKAKTTGHWGRTFMSNRGMAGTTSQWLSRIDMLDVFHARVKRAQIDCRDAIECIRYWDSDETTFYCDPPYHEETRKSTGDYACEVDADFHERLVECLLACHGAVALSGYDHPIYDHLLSAGWRKIAFETACYAASRARGSSVRGKGNALKNVPRVEVLWINGRAQELCDGGRQLSLV